MGGNQSCLECDGEEGGSGSGQEEQAGDGGLLVHDVGREGQQDEELSAAEREEHEDGRDNSPAECETVPKHENDRDQQGDAEERTGGSRVTEVAAERRGDGLCVSLAADHAHQTDLGGGGIGSGAGRQLDLNSGAPADPTHRKDSERSHHHERTEESEGGGRTVGVGLENHVEGVTQPSGTGWPISARS